MPKGQGPLRAYGYTLDVYCACWGKPPSYEDQGTGSYFGETKGEAFRMARADGWILHRDDTSTCPKCATVEGGEADGVD